MKIGLLTTSFPRTESDSAGHFVLGFARALAARGHVLEVVAPEPPANVSPPQFAGMKVGWVPYLWPKHWQRTFYGAGVPDNLRRDPKAWLGLAPFSAQLWRHAQRRVRHWDAVVSHWALPSGLVAGLLCPRRVHLAVLHSADVHALTRLPLGAVAATRLARSSDQLLFVSHDLRQRFLAALSPLERVRTARRCHVSPMGIEPMPRLGLSRASLRRHLGLRRFTLLSLGRLVAIKGVDVAIRAVAALPDVDLVIAGSGPERETLRRRAQQLGASVRFVGHLHGPDKAAWLAAADAFVLPSRNLPSGRTEGSPTTLLEALDMGLPIIASRVGGTSELLRDGLDALLVTPGEPLALARAIQTLQREPARRACLRRKGRDRARAFHWDQISPHVEALLQQPREVAQATSPG